MEKENFENMSVEELRIISFEKNKRGSATSRALKAQKQLWILAGCPYANHEKSGIPTFYDDNGNESFADKYERTRD